MKELRNYGIMELWTVGAERKSWATEESQGIVYCE